MNKNSFVIVMILAFFLMNGCKSSPKAVSVDVFWDTALLQNVTRLTDDGLEKNWAQISPDGTKMLYCESRNSQWNVILLRDVNVAAKTPLITDSSYAPAWYNNNSNFLYVSPDGSGSRIIRSAIAGGGRTFVTRNPVGRYDSRPAIRGEMILFDSGQSNTDSGRQVYSMRDNGTEVTILGDGHSPSWHPREQKFVFIRNGDLYEMDLASIQVTQIFSDPNYNCAMPSYSPNGQYILFQKGAEQKTAGTVTERGIGEFFRRVTNVTKTQTRWQIFTIKADGTNLSPLTFGDVDSYCPSWDRNNFVYFVSNASGKTEIYRARVNLN